MIALHKAAVQQKTTPTFGAGYALDQYRHFDIDDRRTAEGSAELDAWRDIAADIQA